MTSKSAVRRGLLPALLLAGVLAPSAAAAQAPPKIETFTGTTVNLAPGGGENLKIDVFRWADEAERTRVTAAVKEKGASELAAALEKVPTAGYIWGSGSLGYSLRYAHRIAMPDGGERIIVVTDRRLGSWGREPWKATGQAAPSDEAVTVVELRLNKQGRGEGKMSLAAKVAAEAGTIALENYAAAPTLLKDVRRVANSSGATN